MKKLSRKKYSVEFKAKVSIEAIKEQKTLPELAKQYDVHPTQIQQWKKILLEHSANAFNDKAAGAGVSEAKESHLYEQIGKLQVENDWLKKKLS